ncbi:hypothetical protein [Pseudoalteromonas sp. PPB1]|uniref:hypothetical protein n=1 Tax=Pseudoalteromonas sp. PPB1 TaxID=2756136 RepID=UPI001891D57C|nr:hypothetical protein [Pseudoalteromonas sp. PPB1]
MKKLVVTASFCLLSSTAMAASQISQLNVSGDVAIFTLEAPKTHTVPGCVTAENQNKWAVSLSSLQGQALYSLLVTAVSKDKLVSVLSAQRCESVADVEQVQGLNLSSNKLNTNSASDTWIYKGDKVTKIGKVVTIEGNTFTYVPVDGTLKVHNYTPSIAPGLSSFTFLDAECKGDPYQSNYGYPFLTFIESEGAYFTFADSSIKGNRMADHGHKAVYRLGGEGQCYLEDRYLAYQETRAVKLIKTEHPLCGKTPCWIK